MKTLHLDFANSLGSGFSGRLIIATTFAVIFLAGTFSIIILTALPNATSAAAAPSPKITLSPKSGEVGTEIEVKGSRFTTPALLSTVSITFDGDPVTTSPKTIVLKDDGTFTAEFSVPEDSDIGDVKVRATVSFLSVKKTESASATFEVIRNNNDNDGDHDGGNNNPPGENPPDAEPQNNNGNIDNEPTAESQLVEMKEDSSVTIRLRATDVDGSPKFSIVDYPRHGTISGFNAQRGIAIFTPDDDYSGVDRFTFTVQDEDGDDSDDEGVVSITITPVNDLPLAKSQQVSMTEDSQKAITLAGTDYDKDDVLTFSIVDKPLHGKILGTAPYVTYEPNRDYFGMDRFTFRTSDGKEKSELAVVSITVTGVNDPPLALRADTSILTKEDEPVRITMTATDDGSKFLSFSIISYPEHGTLTAPLTTNPFAAITTYTPNPDYYGPDAFTFAVADEATNTLSDPATIYIRVTPVNDAPLVQDMRITVQDISSQEIVLTASDVDRGDDLIYKVLSRPAHGSLAGNAPYLIYSPPHNYDGIDSFTFEVTDGTDSYGILRAKGTVWITLDTTNLNGEMYATPNNYAGKIDATLPVMITFPDSTIEAVAGIGQGAKVMFATAAWDNVDGVMEPECSHKSGSEFPVGDTIVKCTATDKAGNKIEETFEVSVKLNPVFVIILAAAGVAAAVAAFLVLRRLRATAKHENGVVGEEMPSVPKKEDS
jgi:hypothetical protein